MWQEIRMVSFTFICASQLETSSIFSLVIKKGGRCMASYSELAMYGLNENDYKDLKWEDEPLEVFVNMED